MVIHVGHTLFWKKVTVSMKSYCLTSVGIHLVVNYFPNIMFFYHPIHPMIKQKYKRLTVIDMFGLKITVCLSHCLSQTRTPTPHLALLASLDLM